MVKVSVLRMLAGSAVALLLALVTACGGGGGTSATVAAPVAVAQETGTLVLTMADAAGDFLSYTVDVTRIELHKANGDVVQALPLTTRIDFAQLASVSEFLNVATVPAGVYDQVKLVLDYSNAQIVVQDASGNAVAATVVDTAGQPLTTLTATLQLAEADKIRISRGIAANFALDFDLAASNAVALNPAVVTVSPFLLASAQFDASREHRLRGLFKGADKTAASITLQVRPFAHRETGFGELSFNVDGATMYEINGRALTGSAGLDAVAALAVGTPVVAQGLVANKVLTAAHVLAGTSVPGNGMDGAAGVVVSRSGNSFVIRGAQEDNHDGSRVFRGVIRVDVGANTKVTTATAPATALTIGAISVGQLVAVRGVASTVDGARTLDATAGAVRLEVSEVAGDVIATNPLTLSLGYINGLRPGAFTFAGTGTSAANDAQPQAYEIDTTGLDLGAIANGDLVRARGVVNGFGLAPPDFNARSLIDVALEARAAGLDVSWRRSGATATPFVSASSAGVVLDLTTAQVQLHLRGIPRAIISNDAIKTLVPSTDGTGEFAIHVRGQPNVQLLRTFAGAVDAVQTHLAAGDRVLRLSAAGQYNRPNMQLTVRRMAFDLVPPSP